MQNTCTDTKTSSILASLNRDKMKNTARVFKVKYLDFNENVIQDRIMKGRSIDQVYQKVSMDVVTVNGQVLPGESMPNETFYIKVVEL